MRYEEVPIEERTHQLSGKNYVAVLLDGEPFDRDHLGRIPIRTAPDKVSPKQIPCEHGTTVCTACGSQSWQWDYDFLWWRTEGGRELFAKIYPDHEMPTSREATVRFSIEHADRPVR